MTNFTFDVTIFSDLHKDAYGFRPRGHEFYTASDERKQEIWDTTMAALEATMDLEERMEIQALMGFEDLIRAMKANGAADDRTAIRWILQGEDLSEVDLWYGEDFVAYKFGLTYDNPYREVIASLIKEMKFEEKEEVA